MPLRMTPWHSMPGLTTCRTRPGRNSHRTLSNFLKAFGADEGSYAAELKEMGSAMGALVLWGLTRSWFEIYAILVYS